MYESTARDSNIMGTETLLKAAAIGLIGVLAPIHAIMAVAGTLIVADAVTGIWAAKKRGEKITSAALRRTVSKMVIYQLVVITGFLTETFMLEGALPISKVAASAIALTELLSIVENANQILETDIFDKVKKLLGSKNDKKE